MVDGSKRRGGVVSLDLKPFSLTKGRTKVSVYGFMLAFIACTVYVAFFSDNVFFSTASTSTSSYRSHFSDFVSRFFPDSSLGSPEGEVGSEKDGGLRGEHASSGFGSSRDGSLRKNRTSSGFGSSKNGVSRENGTSSGFGSSKNGILNKNQTSSSNGSLAKNQTKSGVESSRNGIPSKKQKGYGNGSSKDGHLLKNQTSSAVGSSKYGVFPKNNTISVLAFFRDGFLAKNKTSYSSKNKTVAGVPPKALVVENHQNNHSTIPTTTDKGVKARQNNKAPTTNNSTLAGGIAKTGVFNDTRISNSSVSLGKGNVSLTYSSAKLASTLEDRKTNRWSIGRMKSCDIFKGRWVKDGSYPLYPAGSCPHIDEPFNCFLNGRPDQSYEKLRWQPNDCNIPRLNATDMLERLKGKRLVFVGDSLNRNMWDSLVCILRNSIKDKKKVFEASGREEFRTEGSYSFLFEDYNCSVEYFRSPFLVQEWEVPDANGTKKETLRLDIIEKSSSKYRDANVIVFNTGHWWTHEKTSKGKDYYQEGDRVYGNLSVYNAFHKALNTWAKWIDSNVNPRKTLVMFRGYSSSHFKGGQWNSGGQCHRETQPIMNEKFLSSYPPKMNILESVLKKMKTPVSYLNITRMTDYRKDGHPSVYRKQKLSEEERKSPQLYQDCSHWCLPGVPDSWNELVYAQLLIRGD